MSDPDEWSAQNPYRAAYRPPVPSGPLALSSGRAVLQCISHVPAESNDKGGEGALRLEYGVGLIR
jgi:hypothetical protein